MEQVEISKIQDQINESRSSLAQLRLALTNKLKEVKEAEKTLDMEQESLWSKNQMTFLDIWKDWSQKAMREESLGKINALQQENKMLETNYRAAIEREKKRQKEIKEEIMGLETSFNAPEYQEKKKEGEEKGNE